MSNKDVKYWCADKVHRYEDGVIVETKEPKMTTSSRTDECFVMVVLASDYDAKIRELEDYINHLEGEVYD